MVKVVRHLYFFKISFQCQYVQYGKDRGDGAFTPWGPGWEAETPRVSGIVPNLIKTYHVRWCVCLMEDELNTTWSVQEREMEMRRHALEEERRRREDLEKRLQEETSRRQRLVEREVKLREKQRSQVLKNTDKNLQIWCLSYIQVLFEQGGIQWCVFNTFS